MALTWTEKLSFLTTKGMSWKEVQEMDKGLDEEKKAPPKEEPKEPPKEEPKEPPKEEPKEPPKEEPKEVPTETEQKLLNKISELEEKLEKAQADNVHGNNGGSQELSFDEQLDSMFKDYRI